MQRKTWIKLFMFIGLVGMLPHLSYAERIAVETDISQGFMLEWKNTPMPIGYITALSISGEEFEATLKVQDPMQPNSKSMEQVVGIISNIRWDGGQSQPILLTCQVESKNKEMAARLTDKNLTNIEVELAFDIYMFYSGLKSPSYLRYFSTNGQRIKGKIETNAGIEINSVASEEVPSPRNYQLYLRVMPSESNQYLLYQENYFSLEKYKKNSYFVMPWGSKTR